VFNRKWALQHKKAVNDFLKASREAKNRLCGNDDAWRKIIPMTQVNDSATQARLRQRYCEGRIAQWSEQEQQAAERIYTLLRTLSGNKLTGQSEHLQPGTFWSIEE
jgi:NitT/TauT family transport system substrate-binding protein